MTNKKAINEIIKSNASKEVKEALLRIVSEWDYFTEIRAKHGSKGLKKACYKAFGVSFWGLYRLKHLSDAVRMAKENTLF